MRFYFLVACLFSLSNVKAQYVTIPDPNFVMLLQNSYPSCMNGNQLDTTCIEITTETIINVSGFAISDLSGVQYFDDLEGLVCSFNDLTVLPTLPGGLTELICDQNELVALPELPASLTLLDCSINQLTELPPLPAGLSDLMCSFNQLSALPAIPGSMYGLHCDHNQLTSLPPIASMVYLFCDNNQLTSLPALPQNLLHLFCGANQLTTLPTLPAGLTRLSCYSNQLTSLPSLPNALNQFTVSNNPALSCMPVLIEYNGQPSDFNTDSTSITCLPNLIQHAFASVPGIDTLPICAPGDPCYIAGACDPVFDSYYNTVGVTTAEYLWYSVPSAIKYRVRLKNMSTGVTNLYFVLAPDTTITLTGLSPNTMYKVQVRVQCSSNGSVLSPWSIPNYTTTQSGTVTSCVPPTNPFATPTSSTTATVNWTSISGASGYQLRYRINGTTTWTPIVINSGTATSTNLTALEANTTYQYQLRTKCSTNPLTWSNYSVIQSFSTPLRVGEEENFAFNVFPNPANSTVTITTSEFFENTFRHDGQVVEITDLCGRRIAQYELHNNHLSVSLDGFSNGSYYVRLLSNESVIGVKKLVVMR